MFASPTIVHEIQEEGEEVNAYQEYSTGMMCVSLTFGGAYIVESAIPTVFPTLLFQPCILIKSFSYFVQF